MWIRADIISNEVLVVAEVGEVAEVAVAEVLVGLVVLVMPVLLVGPDFQSNLKLQTAIVKKARNRSMDMKFEKN